MQDRNDHIFAVLRKDPERAAFLAKFGLGGALVIIAADWAAGLFLPAWAVLPIELLLIIAYASCLTFLIARVVSAADRFQVESALAARRLLNGSRADAPAMHREAGGAASTAVAFWSSPFHQFHFLLRVTEEVKNARRDGRQMSLIAIEATLPGVEMTPALTEKIGLEMAHIASSQAKTITEVLQSGATEFIFSLADSDQKATKAFVSKLVQALGEYWCHFGIALYPADATSAETLLERVQQECDASRRDAGHSQVSEGFAAQVS